MQRFSRQIFIPIFMALGSMASTISAMATVVPAPETTPDQKLEALFAEDFERLMKEYPEWSTYRGRREYNDKWTDLSFEAIEVRKAYNHQLKTRLEAIDYTQLNSKNQVNYDLFAHRLNQSIAGQEFPDEYLVLNQLEGIHQSVDRLLQAMPRSTPEDFQMILKRLDALPVLVRQHIALLKKGLEENITPPQITLKKVPEQLDAVINPVFTENPLMGIFQNLPNSFSQRQSRTIQQQAQKTFTDKILPAFQELAEFFKEDYLPKARTEISFSSLPKGKAWYAHQVKMFTTTDKTPVQIHRIGLREVRRIRREMQNLAKESGFKGSFKEFQNFLMTDPQFFYDKEEDLLIGYRNIAKILDAALPRLFKTLPRTPYGVEAIPAHLASTAPAAFYRSGNIEAGRAGMFVVNTSNPKSRPRWEMEALTLHEGVPGHHLQLALAQEMEDMPEFRRYAHFTVYSEGWGLYAESLGQEMGIYKDPYSRYGRLTFEMWRSIRLVVDTGMHNLGWSREKALQYFIDNSGRAESEAQIEVDRYLVWPGQALAYKIGELKILELRQYAERRLGRRFDLRDFHHEVLKNGALPLDLLEANIKNWVASTRNAN